jgi:transposase
VSSPKPAPRGGEPVDPAPKPARRTFTAEYRDKIIDDYHNAPHGEKSAVLRREGLYQSQVAEWTQARTAKQAGGTGKRTSRRPDTFVEPRSADVATRSDNERLARENARMAKQLAQTEASLEIMGKLSVLLESISESTGTPPRPTKP